MYSLASLYNFVAALFGMWIFSEDLTPVPTLTFILIFVNLGLAMFMAFKAVDTGEW